MLCKLTHSAGRISVIIVIFERSHVTGSVASWLATAIYVAMVTPILYDNSYSLNDSNLKYESYQPYG